MHSVLKELIDLVGGLPNAKRGIVEGLVVTVYIAVVYLAVCAIVPFR